MISEIWSEQGHSSSMATQFRAQFWGVWLRIIVLAPNDWNTQIVR